MGGATEMTDTVLSCMFFILSVQNAAFAKLLSFNLNKPAGPLTSNVPKDIFGKYGYVRNLVS